MVNLLCLLPSRPFLLPTLVFISFLNCHGEYHLLLLCDPSPHVCLVLYYINYIWRSPLGSLPRGFPSYLLVGWSLSFTSFLKDSCLKYTIKHNYTFYAWRTGCTFTMKTLWSLFHYLWCLMVDKSETRLISLSGKKSISLFPFF